MYGLGHLLEHEKPTSTLRRKQQRWFSPLQQVVTANNSSTRCRGLESTSSICAVSWLAWSCAGLMLVTPVLWILECSIHVKPRSLHFTAFPPPSGSYFPSASSSLSLGDGGVGVSRQVSNLTLSTQSPTSCTSQHWLLPTMKKTPGQRARAAKVYGYKHKYSGVTFTTWQLRKTVTVTVMKWGAVLKPS